MNILATLTLLSALFIPMPIDTTVCYMDSTYPGIWLSDYSSDGFCHFGDN